MFDRLLMAIEHGVRASTPLLARTMHLVPQWYVRRLAEAKLRQTLHHVWQHCPAQRERWRAAGVSTDDLDDPHVLEAIPLTTGRDLSGHEEDFFCTPKSELTHVMTTSGTTGNAKKIYMTAGDMQHQLRVNGSHLLHFPGASRVLIMVFMRNSTWTAGKVNRNACREAGLHVVLSTSDTPVDAQVRLIRRERINVIVGGPAYTHRFLFEADVDLRTLGVRWIHIGGQAWTERFRTEIESAWGAKVIDDYASTETGYGIAGECRFQNGLHVGEADYHVEIVAPSTGAVLSDGVEGEIVVTTLSRQGMPLVRYRTGDLATLWPRGKRCACGMPTRRMSRVRGRVDDMLILSSANVYPDEIDRAVRSVEGVTDYQLTIRKNRHRDVLDLTVESDRDEAELRGVLINALRTIEYLRLLHDIGGVLDYGHMRVVPPGSLSRNRPKSVRIIDAREESRETEN